MKSFFLLLSIYWVWVWQVIINLKKKKKTTAKGNKLYKSLDKHSRENQGIKEILQYIWESKLQFNIELSTNDRWTHDDKYFLNKNLSVPLFNIPQIFLNFFFFEKNKSLMLLFPSLHYLFILFYSLSNFYFYLSGRHLLNLIGKRRFFLMMRLFYVE